METSIFLKHEFTIYLTDFQSLEHNWKHMSKTKAFYPNTCAGNAHFLFSFYFLFYLFFYSTHTHTHTHTNKQLTYRIDIFTVKQYTLLPILKRKSQH